MRRPRLKRTVEPITAPNGDIHLMRSSAEDIKVANPTPNDRELLSALDGTRSVGDLESMYGAATVRETLAQMQALNLLEDAADFDVLPPRDLRRFDRQLRYFSDVASNDLSAATCQERLRGATVAVLGVGGNGGRVALELAACGVGTIHLVDGDRVELSNLNRQIQYTEAEIGMGKAVATAARLRAINSEIDVQATPARLESQDDLARYIAGADLVIDAADWPAHEIEFWVNAACFAAGIPYLAMSHFPPIARVGPLYVPGETGCYECQIIRYRREYPLFDVATSQRRGLKSPAATLGPACGVIGGLIGVEAIHFLTSLHRPSTLGVGLTFDLRTLTATCEEIIPEPDCSVCSRLAHSEIGAPA
jgi:bacteriocin biosynthesis cyclodehydratase domain-containing protein